MQFMHAFVGEIVLYIICGSASFVNAVQISSLKGAKHEKLSGVAPLIRGNFYHVYNVCQRI